MLTKEGCAGRARRLLAGIDEACPAAVLADPKTIHRLVSFFPPAATLGNDTLHLLVLDRSGRTTLVVDNWLGPAAKRSFADEVDVCEWYAMTGPPGERRQAVAARCLEVLRAKGLDNEPLAVEGAYLPTAVGYGLTRTTDVTATTAAGREIKDPDEVACVRRAIAVGEAAHACARREARDGLTEVELVARMSGAVTCQAGQSVQLLGDFASGERSITGGGPPTERVMRDGELVILDIFPIVDGFRGDITATLCVGGNPTDRQREAFAVLEAAQQAGEAALVPGHTGGDVYRAVKDTIADAGYGERFTHHAGHGLGAGHPEPPFLVPESAEPIRPGQVVTLEPGIYIPDWGGMRIEHNYLVTDRGPERLSRHYPGL